MAADEVVDQIAAIALALKNEHPTTADFYEGDRRELADRIDRIDKAIADLKLAREFLGTKLALLMETNDELIVGFGYATRSRPTTVAWDNDAYDRAIRTSILDRVTVDPETGEVNQGRRRLLDQTLTAYMGAWNKPTPSATAASKVFGLDVGEYRSTETGPYRVTVRRVNAAGLDR